MELDNFKEDHKKLFDWFWGRNFTGFELHETHKLVDEHGIEKIVECFKIAAIQRKQNLAYVKGILKREQLNLEDDRRKKEKQKEVLEARQDFRDDAKKQKEKFSELWKRLKLVDDKTTDLELQRIGQMLNNYELEMAEKKIIELEKEDDNIEEISLTEFANKFRVGK